MNAVGGLVPFRLPPLHQADRGTIGKLMIDDTEVDQLRITAVREGEAVIRDIVRLKDRPAMLSDVLAGPERLRELLLASVPFDAAQRVEKAAARLEKVLGPEGIVADPRPEFIGGTLTMANVREIVDQLTSVIAPYRTMLKAKK